MEFDSSITVEEVECNVCHHKLDSHTNPNGALPQEGDISICVYCGNLSRFDKNLKIVSLTEEEIEKLKTSDPEAFKDIAEAFKDIYKILVIIKNINK